MAQNIIDALVVTLGLDPSNFIKGSKKTSAELKNMSAEAKKAAQESEERAKRVAEALSKVKSQALSIFAIFTAGKGLKSFMQDALQTGMQLRNLGGNLRMSASELKSWEKTFERAGGTAADATGLFQRAADEIGRFKTGQGIGETLQALMMSGGNINEAVKGPREMVLEMARALQRLNEINPELARARAVQMGLGDAQFSLLKQGPGALEAQVSAQRRLLQLTDAQIQKLAELNAKWADFKTTLEGIANTVLVSALPYLNRLLDLMARHPNVTAAAAGFLAAAAAIKVLGGALGVLAGGAAAGGLAVLGRLGLAGAGAYGGWRLGGLLRDPVDQFISQQSGGKYGSIWDILTGTDRRGLGATNGFTQAEIDSVKSGGGVQLTAQARARLGGSLPRGIRNNNPGNLNFVGQAGATKESGPGGRFAVFQSMGEGIAALYSQLRRYYARGLDTIDEIVRTYAPAVENDVNAYIQALVKSTGLGANQQIDVNDAGQMLALIRGIINHENGAGYVADADILRSIGARGVPFRSMGGNSTEVNIQQINIQTQATDAGGIAKDLRGGIERYPMLSGQSNGGAN